MKKAKGSKEKLPNRCYRCDYSAGAVYGGVLTHYKRDEWCDGCPEMWVCPTCERDLDEGKWEPKLIAESA